MEDKEKINAAADKIINDEIALIIASKKKEIIQHKIAIEELEKEITKIIEGKLLPNIKPVCKDYPYAKALHSSPYSYISK